MFSNLQLTKSHAVAMDEGTSTRSLAFETELRPRGKRVAHESIWGKEDLTDTFKKRKPSLRHADSVVHFSVSHCQFRRKIDVTFESCDERFLTWKENQWNLPGKCLRLNRKKCEDLYHYLHQTKRSYHASTCEIAVREYLMVVNRAMHLVEESCHNDWLLKAVELWECSQHFVEVSLDLFWSSYIMSLGGCYALEENGDGRQRLYSASPIAQAASSHYCDDKKTLNSMVTAKLLDGALRKGSAEHQLALLLQDRLNNQSSWHPPIFTSFNFYIRSKFRLLSGGASTTGSSGFVLTFPWVYEKQFAVKMRRWGFNNVETTFRDEFEVLDKYRSPYIVRAVGYWELESWLDMWPRAKTVTLCPFLLMEAMECDLEGLIQRYKNLRRDMQEGFSPLETIKLTLPIAKALRFLHDKDVAHRDVKLHNIMCSTVMGDFDDAVVKLIDFGEAVGEVSKIPCNATRPTGTNGYMDPEMWKVDPDTAEKIGYDLFRADVFSFAMVFVELLTWKLPSGIAARELQQKLNSGERPPLPGDLPDFVTFIVQCCWCADPTARPTFTDICSMLQNAKLLLLSDENHFFGDQNDLFSYLDGECIDRCITDREFLH